MSLGSRPGRTLRRWPSQCAICHGWGLGRVCEDCLGRHAVAVPRCPRCAIDVPAFADADTDNETTAPLCGRCLLHPPSFDAALAAVDYAHPWAALMTHFKFNAALDLTTALAGLLLQAWQRGGQPPAGLLLPVPLADARLRERGYNQAWELTRRMARATAAPCDASLLLRLKDTPHQLSVAPGRRAANVHGVFVVEPARRGELQGRTVTLVDDVMTTGATLGEATTALKQAGAARVQVWVVARTPRPQSDTMPA